MPIGFGMIEPGGLTSKLCSAICAGLPRHGCSARRVYHPMWYYRRRHFSDSHYALAMPQTLHTPVFYEHEVKKSRFLAWVEPVPDAASAKARIAQLRAQYPDARHVCFAFYAQGNSGMSDDGEPSGTAGKPMFNVLNHKKLVNVVAVVVRYFGGIKLGAGGLSRAYGAAVSAALADAELVAVEVSVALQLCCSFALESQVRRVCQQFGQSLAQVDYQHQVIAQLTVNESLVDELCAALKALAPGDAQFQIQLLQ